MYDSYNFLLEACWFAMAHLQQEANHDVMLMVGVGFGFDHDQRVVAQNSQTGRPL